MRMRKKKHGAKRLAALSYLLPPTPSAPMTDPSTLFSRSAPIYLEIGCGKGGFACGMAAKLQDANFIALEKFSDVMVCAVEKAEACKDTRPDNLRFFIADAATLPTLFAPATVDRIYLNFSDPWPKKGYAKRRLTHREFLKIYLSLLKDGGELYFKTDNVTLFDFTLEELDALGITCRYITRDFHNSPESAGNVMTEYETRFSEQGVPINALAFTKCQANA